MPPCTTVVEQCSFKFNALRLVEALVPGNGTTILQLHAKLSGGACVLVIADCELPLVVEPPCILKPKMPNKQLTKPTSPWTE